MTVPSWRTVPDNTLTAYRNTFRSSLSTMILNDKYVRNLLAPAQQPKLATVQGCPEEALLFSFSSSSSSRDSISPISGAWPSPGLL